MNKPTDEIARELIGMNSPLDYRAQALFGHRKPFGSRWKIASGLVNLVPYKTTVRNVDLHNDYSTVSPEANFRRLYLPNNAQGSRVDIADPEFCAIYKGVRNIRLWASTAIIGISETLATDVPFEHTTADLGRMMLVDQLLFDQDIRGGSRQMMSSEHAELVLGTVSTALVSS